MFKARTFYYKHLMFQYFSDIKLISREDHI